MVCYSNDGIVVRCFDVYDRYLLKWNSIEYQGILRMWKNGGLPGQTKRKKKENEQFATTKDLQDVNIHFSTFMATQV